ncbi:hypothetical protein SAMN05421739_101690 [Pontibacter chinhatensis]|uniref:Uncharacterized protein n=1 Tax=Pontibacter chinhatensis TaxID=1436961 RepID=A0A1I2NG79_9BACT|nr:hypothetical protein SAMN05421739_101690 [Pontibacter chinhatensis]
MAFILLGFTSLLHYEFKKICTAPPFKMNAQNLNCGKDDSLIIFVIGDGLRKHTGTGGYCKYSGFCFLVFSFLPLWRKICKPPVNAPKTVLLRFNRAQQ